MSNETFEEFKYKLELDNDIVEMSHEQEWVMLETWNHQHKKTEALQSQLEWSLKNEKQYKEALDIEIQSKSKMKEEYRHLKELSEYRIKELETMTEGYRYRGVEDRLYIRIKELENKLKLETINANHYADIIDKLEKKLKQVHDHDEKILKPKIETQAVRIKELEGEIERQQAFINAECLRCDNNERESKTLTTQIELLTKGCDADDDEGFQISCLPHDPCRRCENAALIKGKV